MKYDPRTWGAASGFFLAVLIAAFSAPYTGPAVEGKVLPIIETMHVADSVEQFDNTRLCWKVRFHKFRNDAPAYFNYRIRFINPPEDDHPGEVAQFERIPLAVYRIQDDGSHKYLSTFGFANHGSGQRWTASYCAELPRNVHIRRPFVVEGEGFYETWHHLWLVPQTLPTFVVE